MTRLSMALGTLVLVWFTRQFLVFSDAAVNGAPNSNRQIQMQKHTLLASLVHSQQSYYVARLNLKIIQAQKK